MQTQKSKKTEFRSFYLSSRSEHLGHSIVDQLADIDEQRLAYMDAAGIDIQAPFIYVTGLTRAYPSAMKPAPSSCAATIGFKPMPEARQVLRCSRRYSAFKPPGLPSGKECAGLCHRHLAPGLMGQPTFEYSTLL
jgi:hypothetical protein